MKSLLYPNFSEEKFAAFLDGRLSSEEMQAIQKELDANPILNEIINDVSCTPINSGESAIDDYPDLMVEDTINQLIPFVEESINETDFNHGLSGFDIPHPHFDGEHNSLYDDNSLVDNGLGSHVLIDNQTNNYMANTFNTYRNWGESGENLRDPIFIAQPDDHSCALRSQQIVLRDFGIDIPFEDLERIALEAGVYTNEGTYTCDIGKVLEIAGVGMHQVQGGTIYDLTNELAQGHRVIVSVDAHELWYNDGIVNKTTNWLNDVFGEQGGNHALIVAGVEVNPDNPDDVKVVLTDPGTGDLRIEYPLEQFMDAWQDSNCFMAATDAPAPFQYDAQTGMEVPSNFATQQFYNQFVLSNSYQLNPDMINIPEGYLPAYNGHLDMLGDVPYEEFHDKYDDLQGARQGDESSHSIVGNAIHSLIGDLKGLFSHHDSTINDAHFNDAHEDHIHDDFQFNHGDSDVEDINYIHGDSTDHDFSGPHDGENGDPADCIGVDDSTLYE